jgi:hypothetical protein
MATTPTAWQTSLAANPLDAGTFFSRIWAQLKAGNVLGGGGPSGSGALAMNSATAAALAPTLGRDLGDHATVKLVGFKAANYKGQAWQGTYDSGSLVDSWDTAGLTTAAKGAGLNVASYTTADSWLPGGGDNGPQYVAGSTDWQRLQDDLNASLWDKAAHAQGATFEINSQMMVPGSNPKDYTDAFYKLDGSQLVPVSATQTRKAPSTQEGLKGAATVIAAVAASAAAGWAAAGALGSIGAAGAVGEAGTTAAATTTVDSGLTFGGFGGTVIGDSALDVSAATLGGWTAPVVDTVAGTSVLGGSTLAGFTAGTVGAGAMYEGATVGLENAASSIADSAPASAPPASPPPTVPPASSPPWSLPSLSDVAKTIGLVGQASQLVNGKKTPTPVATNPRQLAPGQTPGQAIAAGLAGLNPWLVVAAVAGVAYVAAHR